MIQPVELPVHSFRSASVASVKLIDCENRMLEYGDDHGYPNVDCQFVAFMGCVVELPPGAFPH